MQDKRRGDVGLREWLDAPFSDFVDLFLDDVKTRKSPATYYGYRDMLELAQQHMGLDLRVSNVRKMHLTKIEQALQGGYSPTTIFKCLHSVQRVFAWAVESAVRRPTTKETISLLSASTIT